MRLRAAEAALQGDSDDGSGAEGVEKRPDGSESVGSADHAAHLTAWAGKVWKRGRPRNPDLLAAKIRLLQELGVPEAVIEELVKRKAALRYCSAETLRGAVEWLLPKRLSDKGIVTGVVADPFQPTSCSANEDLLRQHGLTDSEIVTILGLGSFSHQRSHLQEADAIVQLLAQELTQEELVKVTSKSRVLKMKFPEHKGVI